MEFGPLLGGTSGESFNELSKSKVWRLCIYWIFQWNQKEKGKTKYLSSLNRFKILWNNFYYKLGLSSNYFNKKNTMLHQENNTASYSFSL